MIIAERKALDEIMGMIADYRRILVLGCGTCVTICWAGGEKEVGILSSQLRLARKNEEKPLDVLEATVERQCEPEMVEEITDQAQEAEAILSMACGVGVQTVADLFEAKPVFGALNTTFLGMPEGEGVWAERCAACGDCKLYWTGGICPAARCAKGLLNGPCGGTRRGGKCETDPEKDCAWVLIYRRLEQQGRLDSMERYYEPRNYRAVKRPGRIVARQA